MTRKRRSYKAEFKLKAATLVLGQGYAAPEVCWSLGINENILQRSSNTPTCRCSCLNNKRFNSWKHE